MDCGISVIIGTTCEPKRRDILRRAIQSVLEQRGVTTEVIIVVNGSRYDRDLLDELQASSGLRVDYLAEPSFPGALNHGRRLVTQPFFSILDDDDVYLPDALRTRLGALADDPSLDWVATNWYEERPGGRRLGISDPAPIWADPLFALFQKNWMGTGASLFRSATVSELGLNHVSNAYEWTQLAFNLLVEGRRMVYLDTPTMLKYEMTESLYKRVSQEILDARLSIFENMVSRAPTHVKSAIRKHQAMELHEAADYYLRAGDGRRAWRYHVRSLQEPSGARYARFTVRLLLHTIKTVGATAKKTEA